MTTQQESNINSKSSEILHTLVYSNIFVNQLFQMKDESWFLQRTRHMYEVPKNMYIQNLAQYHQWLRIPLGIPPV